MEFNESEIYKIVRPGIAKHDNLPFGSFFIALDTDETAHYFDLAVQEGLVTIVKRENNLITAQITPQGREFVQNYQG